MGSDRAQLARSLVTFNAISVGVVAAVLMASGLWTATIVLLLKGGVFPGYNLRLLGHYFPGYSISVGGAFLGAIWAGVAGFLLITPTAAIYYRGVVKGIDRARAADDASELGARAWIDVPHLAAAFGFLCGFALFLATVWLIAIHQPGMPLGPTLSIIGQYLPGYRVTVGGAVIGFFWGLGIGAGIASWVGWVYNRITFGSTRAAAGAES